MTAVPALSAPSAFNRVWNVVRLHMISKNTFIVIPWLILFGAMAVSLIIPLLLAFNGVPREEFEKGAVNSWAVLSPMWYLCAVAVLAIAQFFPFSLGFGVTRRDFYLGTSLVFLMSSVPTAAVLATLGALETATDGWGLGARMYTALFFDQGSWIANFFIFAVIQLGILFVGAAIATVYMRWRMWGMLVFWLGAVVAIVLALSAITLTDSWPVVGETLANLGVIGIFAWTLVPVALAGFAGFFILRRATPKN